MSVSVHPAIAGFDAPRAPIRAQTVAAIVAAALVGWTLFADPLARGKAVALLSPAPHAVKFGDVVARRTEMDGQTILFVEGTLRNATTHALRTPALHVALIGDDGRALYSWTAKAARAKMEGAGEAEFRTRLLSPPAFKSIAVTLADGK